ncbi:lipopolysaccharide assembly protein LapA domain-containing protein [Benzoatithermus flavus]|uniref:Lipopolysaccharide assembly protein LapA domain-containing protein n=1 Tax=Benzoatithermus flavus TaxID=3108223 RepID=A0ABU8XTC5_9PROT
MIKLLRLLLALVGVIVIVVLAVDNRAPVQVAFWPLPFDIEVPLYGVLLFGLILGALLGGVAMWLSSLSDRREVRALRRRVRAVEYQEKLQRERKEQEILEQARRKTQAIAIAAPRSAA